MTRTVNIEVYCESASDGERDIFAIASEHRPDFPKPFDEPMQKWAEEEFDGLDVGESVENAGEMVYEPNGDIIEFRRSD